MNGHALQALALFAAGSTALGVIILAEVRRLVHQHLAWQRLHEEWHHQTDRALNDLVAELMRCQLVRGFGCSLRPPPEEKGPQP